MPIELAALNEAHHRSCALPRPQVTPSNPRTNLNSKSPKFARLTDSRVDLAVLH